MSTLHDEAWLERIFIDHSRQLRAYCVRRIGPDVADDAVAEVFVILWKRRSRVPEPVLPWLYATARHVILHTYRSHARRLKLHSQTLFRSSARSAEENSVALVDSVLADLPESDAEILRLTIWEELTPAEIAEVLELTPEAARARLSRARAKARRLYQVLGGAHDTNIEPIGSK